MTDGEEKIAKLKAYFEGRKDVVMAFLFGSQAKGYARAVSDWDIGVYVTPKNPHDPELEVTLEYPAIDDMQADVERIVEANVDLVVLNRAHAPLVFTVLNSGVPLAVRDRRLYLRLLTQTFYEAVDFWEFTRDFWRIRERSHSLSPEDRDDLTRHLVFLENELADLERFRKVDQHTYIQDRDMKRIIERWVENIVMASLDIAKILLSSDKKDVPNSYRDTLRAVGLQYFDEAFADTFGMFADLRNIVAHEYLDMRWERIRKFMEHAEKVYPVFLARTKELIGT